MSGRAEDLGPEITLAEALRSWADGTLRYQKEIERLRAENAKLRDALRPFGRNAASIECGDMPGALADVTLADLKRARRALTEKE